MRLGRAGRPRRDRGVLRRRGRATRSSAPGPARSRRCCRTGRRSTTAYAEVARAVRRRRPAGAAALGRPAGGPGDRRVLAGPAAAGCTTGCGTAAPMTTAGWWSASRRDAYGGQAAIDRPQCDGAGRTSPGGRYGHGMDNTATASPESVTTVADHPSGAQWTIAADGHEAVVVEVGGGLRQYRAGGVGLPRRVRPSDEICPGSAGQVLAPWPNRIRDGHYTFGGERAPAAADRAGPAQRDPRPGQLAALAAAWSRPADSVTRRSTSCRRSPATRGRCCCAPAGRSGADGLRGRRTRSTNIGDRAVPVRAGRPTRTCGCPACRSTTSCCACRPGPGCWSTAGCCRSARPRWPAASTTSPSPAGSARPCWTPRSATWTATPTAARR